MKNQYIELGDLHIKLKRRSIRQVELTVHPDGRVEAAAPRRMKFKEVQKWADRGTNWVHKKIKIVQSRHPRRIYVTGEKHYYLGKRYTLKVITNNIAPRKVVLKRSTIELHMGTNFTAKQREAVLNSWYRRQLKAILLDYISKFEKDMGVRVRELGIKKMKTKWGTCNPWAKRIWINLELAKRRIECIRYNVAHEMVHLRVKKHNQRFFSLMDRYEPDWERERRSLRSSDGVPVRGLRIYSAGV